MRERIIIQNFGGLKEVSFDFKAINILIGPQASGKSITVKLMYFFKNFFAEIYKSIENGETKQQLDSRQKERFINYFPKDSWNQGAFKIEYQINHSYIMVERVNDSSIKFCYSEQIEKLINKGNELYKDHVEKIQKDPNFQLLNYLYSIEPQFKAYVSEQVAEIAAYNQFFVPAGRSFFANIQTSIFSFISQNRSLDPFFIEFGAFYEKFKLRGLLDSTKTLQKYETDTLISKIIDSNYIREKDTDFLIHKDGRKVNLVNASSGQQEALPLLLVLRGLVGLDFFNNKAVLYIEEPETHLFPTAQKRVVQLLARTYNSPDRKFQIFITTHSPYILSSFNSLIEAGKILNNKPKLKNKLSKVIPQEEIIGPDSLIAYSLNRGKKKVLIDKSTKLISQNLLDDVSDEIAIEFGKLLDLAY